MSSRSSMSALPILVMFAAISSVAAQQPSTVAARNQVAGLKAAHEVAAEVPCLGARDRGGCRPR